MTLGFFGTGNMSAAILRGVLASGLLCAKDLRLYDVDAAKTAALQDETGARAVESAKTLIEQSDALLLAVKPNVLSAILAENAALLKEKQPLLLSIAAGKTLGFLQALLPFPARLVRVMPNLNATVGAAVSAFCGNENATANDLAFAEKLCASFGTALPLSETQFPVFGVLGGCAPAFVLMFIDALAAAGVKNGLPKQTALAVAAEVARGSAMLLQTSGEHPHSLIDRVCSPGGTTIEGVLALQKDGFETAIHDAVQAALEKDKLL